MKYMTWPRNEAETKVIEVVLAECQSAWFWTLQGKLVNLNVAHSHNCWKKKRAESEAIFTEEIRKLRAAHHST